MGVFALIQNGAVANIVTAAAVADLPTGETWVDIDATSPQPGIGWTYNGSAFASNQAAPTAAQQFAALQAQAQAALDVSDRAVIRCAEHGVAVPAAWVSYRAALRDIVNGTSSTATALPAAPAYPAGT